eukprot:9213_1
MVDVRSSPSSSSAPMQTLLSNAPSSSIWGTVSNNLNFFAHLVKSSSHSIIQLCFLSIIESQSSTLHQIHPFRFIEFRLIFNQRMTVICFISTGMCDLLDL